MRPYCLWFDNLKTEWFVVHEWLNGEDVVVAVSHPYVSAPGC